MQGSTHLLEEMLYIGPAMNANLVDYRVRAPRTDEGARVQFRRERRRRRPFGARARRRQLCRQSAVATRYALNGVRLRELPAQDERCGAHCARAATKVKACRRLRVEEAVGSSACSRRNVRKGF